jgi:molecular chaperone DnaK
LTEYFGKEPVEGVHRDEAVVSGAAIQAGILADNHVDTWDLLIQDVCPLTLGIQAYGDAMAVIISRNSIVPVLRTREFILPAHTQSSVLIRVFEGENLMVEDNSLLGELELTDLPHVPDGDRQVQVTFYIDEDGVFSVSATAEGT